MRCDLVAKFGDEGMSPGPAGTVCVVSGNRDVSYDDDKVDKELLNYIPVTKLNMRSRQFEAV